MFFCVLFTVSPISLNVPVLDKYDDLVDSESVCGNCEPVSTKYFLNAQSQ